MPDERDKKKAVNELVDVKIDQLNLSPPFKCPKCGNDELDAMRKPTGVPDLWFCPECGWAGDRWSMDQLNIRNLHPLVTIDQGHAPRIVAETTSGPSDKRAEDDALPTDQNQDQTASKPPADEKSKRRIK